jgi:hypothetical protein
MALCKLEFNIFLEIGTPEPLLVDVCETASNYALLWICRTINLNYPKTFSGKLPFIQNYNDNCETVYGVYRKLIYVSVMGKYGRKSKLPNSI